MKRIFIFAAAAAICLALLLAGCAQPEGKPQTGAEEPSGEEAPAGTQEEETEPSGSNIIEPDQLISKAEAETLLALSVKDGDKSEQPVVGLKICFYDAQDEDASAFLQVSLTQQAFMPGDSPNTPESIFGTTKDAFSDGLEAVEGIGDDAFIATPGLHILADGCYIVIAAGNTSDEDVKAILRQAGALAVQRLQELLAGQ